MKIKKIMALSHELGSTVSRLQNHYEETVYTTQFPAVPGTHLINLERMKGSVDLGAIQWF